MLRIAVIGPLLAVALSAADLPDWYTRVLPDAEFQARLVQETTEIEGVAGDSFGGDVILVEVRVRPLYGSVLALSRDEFMLRARNNNDTSPARSPDRIAGSAVLDLGTEKSHTTPGLLAEDPNSPIWGGLPGTGTRPRRLPGPPSVAGGGTSNERRQTVDQRNVGSGTAADRLLAVELPLELEDSAASGYLYFEVPAKVKRKHLELSYDGVLGEFLIEFKKPE